MPDSSRHQLFAILTSIFVTCLVVANLIGSLLIEIPIPAMLQFWLKKPIIVSAGIVPFPVTFLLTDLINEHYGVKGARFITAIGFAMAILTFVFLWVGQHLPAMAHSPFPPAQYLKFSQLYTGMFVASLSAYLLGQLLDIQLFQWFFAWTGRRFLWLRATGSTVISQLFDSVIVTSIAFAGQLSWDTILRVAWGNYGVKFLVALCITPLLYLAHQGLTALLSRSHDTGH